MGEGVSAEGFLIMKYEREKYAFFCLAIAIDLLKKTRKKCP